MTSPLEFRSIDHITLIVADLERTRQFYCDQLGMQEVERPNFEFPGLWLTPRLAGSEPGSFLQALIHITLADEDSGLAGWGDRQVRRTSRGHHFAMEVADAERAHRHVAELGLDRLALDELDVVEDQQVDAPQPLLVGERRLGLQGVDEAVHEPVGGQVDHPAPGLAGAGELPPLTLLVKRESAEIDSLYRSGSHDGERRHCSDLTL